jgi:hypothetical protein
LQLHLVLQLAASASSALPLDCCSGGGIGKTGRLFSTLMVSKILNSSFIHELSTSTVNIDGVICHGEKSV